MDAFEFKKHLYRVASGLSTADVRNLKFICEAGYIQRRLAERIKTGFHLLCVLAERKHISPQKLELLESLLSEVHKTHLLDPLRAVEGRNFPAPNPAAQTENLNYDTRTLERQLQSLLRELEDRLPDEDFRNLALFFFDESFSLQDIEQLDNPSALFQSLRDRGIIGLTDLQKMQVVLEIIGRKDLCQLVQDYIIRTKDYIIPMASGAGPTCTPVGHPLMTSSQQEGDTEQCTLNPPPAKQPKLSIETQPSHSHHLSQPHPQPSQPHHQPSLTLPHANLDPSSFPLPMHSRPSQPLPPPSLPPHHSQPLHHCTSEPILPQPHPSQVHPLTPHPSLQPPKPHPLSSISLYASHLRAFYNTELPADNKWPPTPSKKFINLAVIIRDNFTREELNHLMLKTLHGSLDDVKEIKAPIEMCDILNTKPGEILRCVLVEGAPGVGKTTFAWEICRKWGREELFQQYATVILLTLRDTTVQEANTLADLIFYDGDDAKRQILQHLTHTDGKDTLIVLEGLDELPQHLLTQSSIFTQLLSGEVLAQATILITSRPSATVQLWKNWKRRISRHIEVLGFTEENITDYVQSTLSHQELVDFNNYLSTNPTIKLMMYIPIHAAIVIAIFKCCHSSSRPFPTTTTELYTRLVQTILLRYLDSHPDCKLKNDKADIDEFTDLLPPVSDHFFKLTRMAFDGVTQQKLITHDHPEAIEHLGFIDIATERIPYKRSVSYSYNFLHLSVQEYLAAYFVSFQSIDVQQQLLRIMCTEQHLRNMGRFLAGITKFKGMDRTIVKEIIENECKEDMYHSLNLSPYALQLLHESGDCSFIEGHSAYKCTLTDYNPLLDFSDLGYCIANSSFKWRLVLGGTDYYMKFTDNYMQSTDRIDLLIQPLKNHSNPCYTIERIFCNYDAPECVQHLLLELPPYALQQIESVWLVCNSENPQPLPQCVLKYIISNMSKLCELGLERGAISTSGAIAIADIIKNNHKLRGVYMYHNGIGAEGLRALDKIREVRTDLWLFSQ